MAITLDELKEWLDEKFNNIDSKFDTLDLRTDVIEAEIVAEKDIFNICTTCHGLGYTIGFEDATPGPIHTICTLCNGEKRIKKGTLNIQ